MILLGAWCFWEGSHHPFQFYTGVKGSGHGYTLAAVGLATILMGMIESYLIAKLLYKKFVNLNP